MSAHVDPVGSRKFRAWCDDHQDGINEDTPQEAARWASNHNERHHKAAA